jgi:murein DD-endopeptidase MepM/ murein hydrolase activator NlpD
MRAGIAILLLLLLSACSKQNREDSAALKEFSYTPPGQLVPSKSGKGRVGDNYIYAKGIRFPLEKAPAYINSQVYGVGGLHGEAGSLCDQRNYQYPWHDNYCEKRSWGMPLCPSGKGHQGVDIRASTCEKRKYYAVAVEKGVISSIGKYTVTLRGESGRTYRYMHLDSKTLKVRRGERVKRGQRIGLVSDNMGKTKTSVHLHFDMQQTIVIDGHSKKVFVPIYSSLVDAYKRLLKGNP